MKVLFILKVLAYFAVIFRSVFNGLRRFKNQNVKKLIIRSPLKLSELISEG